MERVTAVPASTVNTGGTAPLATVRDGAEQDDSCDHGAHGDHAGHGGHGTVMALTGRSRRVTAIREGPSDRGGAWRPRPVLPVSSTGRGDAGRRSRGPTSLAMELGSGGGRGEAIRTIYYSDRQLPPGHDPGADSGEAPTAGSVAHGHQIFWLSAAATLSRGAKCVPTRQSHDRDALVDSEGPRPTR
jgi:hypothetical protein